MDVHLVGDVFAAVDCWRAIPGMIGLGYVDEWILHGKVKIAIVVSCPCSL